MSLQLKTIVGGEIRFLDLFKDEPIVLNLSASEIQDITKKNSAFSQQFQLPGTKNNNEIFNFYYDINSVPLDFNPNNKFSSSLIWDGYEIMVGYIRLNSLSINGGEVVYSITFYNQIGDLSANIGDKYLYNTNLSGLSHTWSSQVILESNLDPDLFPIGNQSYQDGRIFWGLFNIGYDYVSGNTVNSAITPLLQFTDVSGNTYNPNPGNFDFSGTPVRDYYYKPAIQVKELYKSICNDAGYKIKSEFFDTSYFKRYYLPLKFGDETVYPKNAQIPCFKYTNGDFELLNYPGESAYTQPNSGITCNSLSFPTTSTNFEVNSDYAGAYTYRFTITVDPLYACLYDPYWDETLKPSLAVLFTDGVVNPIPIYNGEFCNLITQTVTFEQQFIFTGTSNASFILSGYNINVLSFTTEIVNGPRFLVSGQTIDYAIEFPDNEYKQIDFISSINRYFNLVVVPDPDNLSELIVEPIVDYFGEGPVLDWTTKVDFNSPQNISPTTSLINGTLNFDFKVDNDYTNQDFKTQVNRTFGTDNFQLNLEFKDNVTKFESMFSSPIDTTINCANAPQLTLTSMSKLKTVNVSGQTLQTFVPFKTIPKLIFRGLTLPQDNYGFLADVLIFTGNSNCTSPVTFAVTDTGWLRYQRCDGSYFYFYAYNTTPSAYISDCMNPATFGPGFPYADLGSITITSSGNPCLQSGFTNIQQYYYMNGYQMDRLTLTNRFTTYPFAISGFSHYVNWKGSDFSNVVPITEYLFPEYPDLYNYYYEDYINDLISEENKIYSCKIYLYPWEVKALKFNEKILINNSYFRINKISNYSVLEPSIADVELIKLTKDYDPHPIIYYRLLPCDEMMEVLYTNSDLMFNLFAYNGNYVRVYSSTGTYIGCFQVEIYDYVVGAQYQKYYLSNSYIPNLVNVFPDCGCTGRTDFNIIQEEPATPIPSATPTPTPSATPSYISPTPTPSYTPTPSVTPDPEVNCQDYQVFPDYPQTIYWNDCYGNPMSAFASSVYNISCAETGSVSLSSGYISPGPWC